MKTNNKKGNQYGNKAGVEIFFFILKYSGIRSAYFLFLFLLPYYIILKASVRESASYYLMKMFPKERGIKFLLRLIAYIHQFGLVLIDRAAMGVLGKKNFSVEFKKGEELYRLAQQEKGIVLLTSHVGPWQIAMAHMKYLSKPINFMMYLVGMRSDLNFFDIARARKRFKIIDVTGYMGGTIQATEALKNSECIAVMGDRNVSKKTFKVMFLGKPAGFPVTGQYLAAHTGSILIMLLTKRTGRLSYSIDYYNLTDMVQSDTITDKKELYRRYTYLYAKILEEYVRKNPYMWFNFYDFWR